MTTTDQPDQTVPDAEQVVEKALSTFTERPRVVARVVLAVLNEAGWLHDPAKVAAVAEAALALRAVGWFGRDRRDQLNTALDALLTKASS